MLAFTLHRPPFALVCSACIQTAGCSAQLPPVRCPCRRTFPPNTDHVCSMCAGSKNNRHRCWRQRIVHKSSISPPLYAAHYYGRSKSNSNSCSTVEGSAGPNLPPESQHYCICGSLLNRTLMHHIPSTREATGAFRLLNPKQCSAPVDLSRSSGCCNFHGAGLWRLNNEATSHRYAPVETPRLGVLAACSRNPQVLPAEGGNRDSGGCGRRIIKECRT